MKSRYLEIVLILGTLLANPATAAADTEAVTNFTQTATLNHAGQLTIDQQIDYDYAGAIPHNLTLGIPVSYHDDQGRQYRMTFRLLAAAVNGIAIHPSSTIAPEIANLTLPVSSSQAPSATHFTLRYTLAPTTLVADQGDVFRFVVTGLAWTVPINHASVQLQAPSAFTNLVCYTGTSSANTSTCEITQTGSTASIATDAPLLPGATLSLFASFGHGSFVAYLQPYQVPASWLGLELGLGLVVAVIILVIILARRLSLRRPIVPDRPSEYTKPNDTP